MCTYVCVCVCVCNFVGLISLLLTPPPPPSSLFWFSFFEKVVKHWVLDGRIIAVTTNGASNIKKCVTMFNEKLEEGRKPFWIHCAAHSIQLCINHSFRDAKVAGDLFKKCEGVVKFFNGCGAARKPWKRGVRELTRYRTSSLHQQKRGGVRG